MILIRLSSGSVAVANNQITGGTFNINIKSLELEQKGGMFDEKLRPHLMSEDFFDADRFGTAKFEITNVDPTHQTPPIHRSLKAPISGSAGTSS